MSLEILSLTNLPEDLQHQIRNLDKDIKLTMAPGWFDGEIRDTWPTFTVDRYLSPMSHGQATKEERDKDLEDVKKAADGGIMSAYSLGGMAEPEFGGLLRGPGTGTSDSIPGMIYQNGKPVQRAALSDGEFVFTNKAVKAAGGGSIEKGADAMYELMNNLEARV